MLHTLFVNEMEKLVEQVKYGSPELGGIDYGNTIDFVQWLPPQGIPNLQDQETEG